MKDADASISGEVLDLHLNERSVVGRKTRVPDDGIVGPDAEPKVGKKLGCLKEDEEEQEDGGECHAEGTDVRQKHGELHVSSFQKFFLDESVLATFRGLPFSLAVRGGKSFPVGMRVDYVD